VRGIAARAKQASITGPGKVKQPVAVEVGNDDFVCLMQEGTISSRPFPPLPAGIMKSN
jgi:hypothetical protein